MNLSILVGMRRVLFLAFVLVGLASPAYGAVPAGFAEESYTSTQLGMATGATWAPDGSGRLFVTSKNGPIRVIRTAAGKPITEAGTATLVTADFAVEPNVHTNSESGVLGLAFDPNYVVNRWVYVFVTVSATEQQIVRYTDVGGGVDAPGEGHDRTVIVSGLPTRGQNNVGGGIAFGGDGKLYFGIGDLGDGTGVNADLTSLASKIGRANVDGTAASDNPFNDGVGPNNEYIWARGLRNPFGLVMQPSTGALWTMVAGTNYEQVFQLERRAHAGYSSYENNQPTNYNTPKIAYRTNSVDTRTIVSATRTGNVLTVSTTANHGFRAGSSITLAGLSNAAFNGNVYVSSVPTETSFTVHQAGNDGIATGGTATTAELGGSITRGAFYDATAFPSEYRGNLLFGDYNSGTIVRAVIASTNAVERVDAWGSGFASNVQVTVGNDGALYTIGFNGGRVRRVSPASPTQKLIVANTTPRILEGGRATFSVSLAAEPAGDLTATVTRTAGDTDIEVRSGASLTFTKADWQQPRAVVLEAAADADDVTDVSTFDVTAPGLTTEQVVATSIENTGPQLVLSTDTLSVPEGGEATVTVAWSAPLAKATTVTITRVGGDADLSVVAPTTLSFTPANATTPQTVTFAAAQDDDDVAGHAQVAIASTFGARALEVVEVDDEAPPPQPDAGTTDDAGADAGVIADGGVSHDSGTADGGSLGPVDPTSPEVPSTGEETAAEDDSGCGCHTHARGSGGGALALLVGALFVRRRRRAN